MEGSCEQVEDVERKSTCLGGYVLLLARLTYSSSRFFKSNKRMCPRTIVFLRLAAVGYHSDTSAAWPDIFLLGPLVRLGSRVSHLRLQCECNIKRSSHYRSKNWDEETSKFPKPIWDLIKTAPTHQYKTRNTDMKLAWFPKNETVSRAMFWQEKTVINATKYNQMSEEGMSKTNLRDFIQRMLIGHYWNNNC